MAGLGLLAAIGRECWWWVSGLGGLLRRHPGRAVRLTALVFIALAVDYWMGTGYIWPLSVGLGVPSLGFALWNRLAPRSYARHVAGPLWRRAMKRWIKGRWSAVMEGAGLTRKLEGVDGKSAPTLVRARWDKDGSLCIWPRLLTGQTIDDVMAAAERLRTAFKARALRVVPNPDRTTCHLVVAFHDHLAHGFGAEPPNPAADVVSVDEAVLGKTEDGQPWRLQLRASTLTAGATGSGKGSIMWGLILSQAPNIRSGLVQLYGADLKAAMEQAMGRTLFTSMATQPEEAVVMLESLATRCLERAERLAGVVRMHQPTVSEPMVILVIDELAVLVGYQTDRELLKRAEQALSQLLAVGRAVGFYVYAFLQDPRKETVKMRHLFPQSIGLRLRQKDEIAMVLGDGAAAAGARCDQISRAVPGTGYVITDDGDPIRVRAGYVSDALIKETARLFPAPVQIPIVLPETTAAARSSRRRSAEQADCEEEPSKVNGSRRDRPSKPRRRAKEGVEG